MGKAGYGTYFFFGSCCFAMFFFVWFLIPETKGMSLERMDDMYVLLLRPSSVIYQGRESADQNSFGVTELAKAHIDEEGAHASANINEKPHNTHVQKTTADVISPRDRGAQRGEVNKI
jgi:hypothetical protein